MDLTQWHSSRVQSSILLCWAPVESRTERGGGSVSWPAVWAQYGIWRKVRGAPPPFRFASLLELALIRLTTL